MALILWKQSGIDYYWDLFPGEEGMALILWKQSGSSLLGPVPWGGGHGTHTLENWS